MKLGILSALLAKILSFCKLNWASTVKIFSSEKIIFPESMRSFIQFRRILALSILFWFCNAVSWCLLVLFKGDNLRSSLTIVLAVFSSIFKFLAIFLGFLLIHSLMALILVGVQAVQDCPLLGRSSDVPSSFYQFTAS